MMQQASFDFGFDAEDLPLMIEAIPSSADSIVLIITKVEDPEELDTRFSKFTPLGDSDTVNNDVLEKLQGADEFLDLLNKVKRSSGRSSFRVPPKRNRRKLFLNHSLRFVFFSFSTLDSVIRAARLAAPFYKNANTLYKDKENHTYILALAPGSSSDHEFNKICNMLSEYSTPEKSGFYNPCFSLKSIARSSYQRMQYRNWQHFNRITDNEKKAPDIRTSWCQGLSIFHETFPPLLLFSCCCHRCINLLYKKVTVDSMNHCCFFQIPSEMPGIQGSAFQFPSESELLPEM